MSTPPDEDLRDVFRLLYADEEEGDWAFSDDEDDEVTPVESALSADVDQLRDGDSGTSYSSGYTRKRFMDELDSLFSRTTKKARIFPSPLSSPSTSYIPSTSPIPKIPAATAYAPYSPLPLLSRLRTFAQHSFLELETPLDGASLAKNGWVAMGRYEIACGSCGGKVSVKGLEEIKDGGVRREVGRRLGRGIKGKHGVGCPWRVRDCPDDLPDRLRKLVHPIISSSLALLAIRLDEECGDKELRWTSPLTVTQLSTLQTNLPKHVDSASSPSHFAIATAWFGWYPYHPNSLSSHIDPTSAPEKTDIIHCRACQRRIGLWAFKRDSNELQPEQREFDVLGEHLTWCPIRNGEWWEESGLLKGKQEGVVGEKVGKGWVKVSEKMEKKPWRRV